MNWKHVCVEITMYVTGLVRTILNFDHSAVYHCAQSDYDAFHYSDLKWTLRCPKSPGIRLNQCWAGIYSSLGLSEIRFWSHKSTIACPQERLARECVLLYEYIRHYDSWYNRTDQYIGGLSFRCLSNRFYIGTFVIRIGFSGLTVDIMYGEIFCIYYTNN